MVVFCSTTSGVKHSHRQHILITLVQRHALSLSLIRWGRERGRERQWMSIFNISLQFKSPGVLHALSMPAQVLSRSPDGYSGSYTHFVPIIHLHVQRHKSGWRWNSISICSLVGMWVWMGVCIWMLALRWPSDLYPWSNGIGSTPLAEVNK